MAGEIIGKGQQAEAGFNAISPREWVNRIIKRYPVSTSEAAATISAVNEVRVKYATFEAVVGIGGRMVAEGKMQPMFSTLENTTPNAKIRIDAKRNGEHTGIDGAVFTLASDAAEALHERYIREGTPDSDYPRRSHTGETLDTPTARYCYDVENAIFALRQENEKV